nr:MAG TPA: hypothetical protein [Caudoviricetes sp.]
MNRKKVVEISGEFSKTPAHNNRKENDATES